MEKQRGFGFLSLKELKWLMENPKLNWLRWILTIPFALIGFGIVLLLQGLENWFYEPANWFILYIQSPIFSIASAFIFVLVGTEMAPSHKKNTSLILLLVSIAIFGYLIFYAIQNQHYTALIYIVPGIIGSFIGYKLAESEYS